MEVGTVVPKLKDVISERRSPFAPVGASQGRGTALSVGFSNTASIGIQLQISDGSPIDPSLEFSVHAGRSRTDIVARAIKSALPVDLPAESTDQVFRFK